MAVSHLLSETYTDCEKCEVTGSMSRMLSKPTIFKRPSEKKTEQVGELTKKYIEENKAILKQQKEEAKETKHESS